MSDTLKIEEPNNDETRPLGSSAEPEKEGSAFDAKQKFIVIDEKGWVTGRIHLSQGLYNIVGFLKEVEDNVRYFFIQRKKEEESKKNLIKPGFRGFNPFKRG